MALALLGIRILPQSYAFPRGLSIFQTAVDLIRQKVYPSLMDEPQKAPEKSEREVPQALVAFIDILGYNFVIGKLKNDLEAIKRIETLLKGVSVDLIESIRTKLSLPEPYDEYARKIFRLINVRYISDTILVTLPFSDPGISSPHFNEREILSHCVLCYFDSIAMTCTTFTAKTGLPVRGGIALGSHYENPQNESLFILSEAYMNAYKLEKQADTPRILIDDPVYEFVQGLPLEQLNNFFFVDASGKRCFDIYAVFISDEHSRTVLSDIKEGVSRNMFENRENERVLGKLIYFAKFHNEKVHRLGFDDLAFNLTPVERHLSFLHL